MSQANRAAPVGVVREVRRRVLPAYALGEVMYTRRAGVDEFSRELHV